MYVLPLFAYSATVMAARQGNDSGDREISTNGKGKNMVVYSIKRGVMRKVPKDSEIRQMVKYIFFFTAGLILGNFWPHLQ